MKLADWRKAQGWTQPRLAVALDCVLPTVARWENGTRTPEREALKRIYILTAGAVQPNDFYDIPAWEAELIRAEGDAVLARKAA